MANVKKLLEGMAGEGIILNTPSVAKYMAERIILVNVSCSRKRGNVSLPPKMLGLSPEKWDEGSKAFYSAHVSMGKLQMVPKDLDNKLNQLETRVRRCVAGYTIDGASCMPISMYEEFKAEFEAIRKEYMETIEKVAGQWESIRTSFLNGVKETVYARTKRTMLKPDRDRLINSIAMSIPTASEYRGCAKMNAQVRVMPTSATVEGLDDDIQGLVKKTWHDDIVASVVRSIEFSMGDLFSKCCKIAGGYAKSGHIDPRTVASLQRSADKVRKMNVFANPMLETLAKSLSEINGDNDDRVEEAVENALVDIWAYSKSTKIKLDMSICPIDTDTFNKMLSLRIA